MTQAAHPMLEALPSREPHQALAAKLSLYGRFVGSWTLDIERRWFDGTRRRAEGEWHFAYVLDGKAVQDVWIFPARRLRTKPEPWHMYGATFRWYDPSIDAWHIRYFEPGIAFEMRQIGRAAGADIVQVGETWNGLLRRWRFVEITDDSFRWLGDASWDKGATWTLETEMRARRVAAGPV
jgi:hypothetical protein